MVQINEDDYYSNLSKSSESDWDSSSKKPKLKIKAKKLKVSKKLVEKKDTISDDTKKIDKKDINHDLSAKKEEKVEEKSVNELIAEHNKKKIVAKKVLSKKPEIKKPVDKKKHERKTENRNSFDKTSFDKKKQDKTSFENKTSSQEKKPANFVKSKSDNSLSKFKWKKLKNSFDDKTEEKKTKLARNKRAKYSKSFLNQVEDDFSFTRSNKLKNTEKKEKKAEDIKQFLVSREWETVTISDVLTIKEFSEKIWVAFQKLIWEFMKNGLMVNINSQIDFETASIVAEAFEIKLEKDNSSWLSVEDIMQWDLSALLKEDDSSKLEDRAPVISIMWHVDHGKTSLLDYIREEKVAAWEAWWITQSIWAYQVVKNDKKITFLDTPGHEAFTVMRSRWAKSTDIAILVVAADEWVKPQTLESINHAKEAWLPIIVAINKMDKEWANPDHVKTQLSENWLISEDWGWDTIMVPVSAKTGLWIDDLLEMILLVSDMWEFKANPNRAWVWTVLESHLDTRLWPVATILINTWEFRQWDSVVCKWSFGKIKTLRDYSSKSIQKAWPSDPVLLVWLDRVVEWGDILQIVSNPEIARKKASEYESILRNKKQMSASWIDLLMSKIKSWTLKQLKIVLKADTNWSLEAIKWSLLKLSTPETKVSIIHSWVWNITESDVLMCQWSAAILVWFNVNAIWKSSNLIEESKIEYINHKVIYHITERIEKIITWMLDPKEVEVTLWEAEVLDVFYDSKDFMIVWLKIKEEQKIKAWADVSVIRWWKLVWKWKVENLKQWIEDVSILEGPLECWIKFVWNVKLDKKDLLDIFEIEIQK